LKNTLLTEALHRLQRTVKQFVIQTAYISMSDHILNIIAICFIGILHFVLTKIR